MIDPPVVNYTKAAAECQIRTLFTFKCALGFLYFYEKLIQEKIL